MYLYNNSTLKHKILKEIHESPIRVHLGFLKTYHQVKQDFFWEGLKVDVQKFVAECLVVVDCLTKYAHFIALSHPFIASIVEKVFLENIQKLHGTPKVIVSDHDPILTSHFWKDLFSCLGTQLAHSSLYHPQLDGKIEVVNKCLEGYLHCFTSEKQLQWVDWLPLTEWWYNTSFHSS